MLKSLGVFEDHTDGSLKSVFSKENNQIIEVTLLFNKPAMMWFVFQRTTFVI